MKIKLPILITIYLALPLLAVDNASPTDTKCHFEKLLPSTLHKKPLSLKQIVADNVSTLPPPTVLEGESPAPDITLGRSYIRGSERGFLVIHDHTTDQTMSLERAFERDASVKGLVVTGKRVYVKKVYKAVPKDFYDSRLKEDLVVIDLSTQKQEVIASAFDTNAARTAISPEGKALLMIEGWGDGPRTATIINTETGAKHQVKLSFPPDIKNIQITGLEISEDGSVILMRVGGDQPRKWRTVRWSIPASEVSEPKAISVSHEPAAIHPEGKYFVTTTSKGNVTLHQGHGSRPMSESLLGIPEYIDTLKPKHPINQTRISKSVFSPDGRYVSVMMEVMAPNDKYERVRVGTGYVTSPTMFSKAYIIFTWDLENKERKPFINPIPELSVYTQGAEPDLRVMNGGRVVAAGMSEKSYYLFDSENGFNKAERTVLPIVNDWQDYIASARLTMTGKPGAYFRDQRGIHFIPFPNFGEQFSHSINPPATSERDAGSSLLALPPPNSP